MKLLVAFLGLSFLASTAFADMIQISLAGTAEVVPGGGGGVVITGPNGGPEVVTFTETLIFDNTIPLTLEDPYGDPSYVASLGPTSSDTVTFGPSTNPSSLYRFPYPGKTYSTSNLTLYLEATENPVESALFYTPNHLYGGEARSVGLTQFYNLPEQTNPSSLLNIQSLLTNDFQGDVDFVYGPSNIWSTDDSFSVVDLSDSISIVDLTAAAAPEPKTEYFIAVFPLVWMLRRFLLVRVRRV